MIWHLLLRQSKLVSQPNWRICPMHGRWWGGQPAYLMNPATSCWVTWCPASDITTWDSEYHCPFSGTSTEPTGSVPAGIPRMVPPNQRSVNPLQDQVTHSYTMAKSTMYWCTRKGRWRERVFPAARNPSLARPASCVRRPLKATRNIRRKHILPKPECPLQKNIFKFWWIQIHSW